MKLEAAAAVLGVAVDADPETLKAAYRRLALRWHPDKCKDADAKERFQEVRSHRAVSCSKRLFCAVWCAALYCERLKLRAPRGKQCRLCRRDVKSTYKLCVVCAPQGQT